MFTQRVAFKRAYANKGAITAFARKSSYAVGSFLRNGELRVCVCMCIYIEIPAITIHSIQVLHNCQNHKFLHVLPSICTPKAMPGVGRCSGRGGVSGPSRSLTPPASRSDTSGLRHTPLSAKRIFLSVLCCPWT